MSNIYVDVPDQCRIFHPPGNGRSVFHVWPHDMSWDEWTFDQTPQILLHRSPKLIVWSVWPCIWQIWPKSPRMQTQVIQQGNNVRHFYCIFIPILGFIICSLNSHTNLYNLRCYTACHTKSRCNVTLQWPHISNQYTVSHTRSLGSLATCAQIPFSM